MQEIVPESEFEKLILEIPNATQSQLISKTYRGTDKLPISFTIHSANNNQKYIIVISSGEFQPGRYKIYLEGIWQLQ